MSATNARVPIGEALIAEGALTPEQLAEALAQQQSTSARLGELLVSGRLVSPAVLVRALGRSLGVLGCVLRHGLIDPALADLVRHANAARFLGIE